MTKEDIKEIIKDEFKKQLAGVGHILPIQWFNTAFAETNPVSRQLVEPAVSELIREGFIEEVSKPVGKCFAITQQGIDEIFPETKDQIIEKIQSATLDECRKKKMEVGHLLQNKFFSITLNPTLHPKERELLNTAIYNMIELNWFEQTEKAGGGLLLNQAGFDLLYQ